MNTDKLFGTHAELLPTFEEARKALFDPVFLDPAMLVGCALWILLLSLSLTTIDRRDQITCLSYCFFMSAAGSLLILLIPARLHHNPITLGQIGMPAVMAAAAYGRWFIGRRALRTVVRAAATKAVVAKGRKA